MLQRGNLIVQQEKSNCHFKHCQSLNHAILSKQTERNEPSIDGLRFEFDSSTVSAQSNAREIFDFSWGSTWSELKIRRRKRAGGREGGEKSPEKMKKSIKRGALSDWKTNKYVSIINSLDWGCFMVLSEYFNVCQLGNGKMWLPRNGLSVRCAFRMMGVRTKGSAKQEAHTFTHNKCTIRTI